jgi:hypothetical protein
MSENFKIKNGELIILNSSIKTLELSDAVCVLSSHCFSRCSSLSSLTIPNSVNSLGNGCFQGCSSLSNLTIPNSVNSLGECCFSRCSSLSTLTIPNSVVEIGVRCFQNCESLQNFVISLRNLPIITNDDYMERYPFCSEAGSDLFIECPFHSSQLTLQLQ